MENFLLFLLIFWLLAAIPFGNLLSWIYGQVQKIDAKLIIPRPSLYCSKVPFLYFFLLLINFLKGYLPLLIFTFSYFEEYNLIILISGLLILNNWNIWQKFENQKKFGLILLGIYSYFSPVLGILFVLAYILSSLLLNSFLLGFLGSIVVLFFGISVIIESPIYLFVNLAIFLIVLFAVRRDLLDHFERSPRRIITSFQQRI